MDHGMESTPEPQPLVNVTNHYCNVGARLSTDHCMQRSTERHPPLCPEPRSGHPIAKPPHNSVLASTNDGMYIPRLYLCIHTTNPNVIGSNHEGSQSGAFQTNRSKNH